MAEAAETMDADGANAPAEVAKPKGKGKLMLIVGLVVLLAGGGGGAYFMLGKKSGDAPAAAEGHEGAAEHGEHGAAAAKAGSANYLEMSPPFVVNLNDDETSRFLQVDMQARGNDSHALEGMKDHLPRIRNAILLLLGQQKYHDIANREGKEKLQAEVLAEVQKIMTEETGKPVVNAIYFTSFVMQ